MAKLYFRYGAMESGKTTALLQVAYNYEQKGMKILLFKPSVDTKGNNEVVSRLGVHRKVDKQLLPEDTITELIKEPIHCIIVDEAQFLTINQVNELYIISKEKNIPVICYGLRCDFLMHGFPGSTRILEIADDIEELKTICKCGKKATQNLRKIDGIPIFIGNQVEIDNQKEIHYEPVCGECYLKLKKKYTKIKK